MILYNNRVIPEWLRITGTISDNKRGVTTLGKPIMQLTLDGDIVRVYGSITAARRAMNCSHSLISNVLTGKLKTAKGYKWQKI